MCAAPSHLWQWRDTPEGSTSSSNFLQRSSNEEGWLCHPAKCLTIEKGCLLVAVQGAVFGQLPGTRPAIVSEYSAMRV